MIEDYEFIKLISKGAYGKVYLVRKKTTNDFYAMKTIKLGKNVNIIRF
jgi:serine/threonine protein kinase